MGADLFPRQAVVPGKFSLNVDLLPPAVNPTTQVCDGRLDLFTDGSFDHVVIGPRLARVPQPGPFVREAAMKLKQKGHLVLYLPKDKQQEGDLYKFNETSVLQLLEESGAWRLKAQITRDGEMLYIAKKIAGQRGTVEPVRPRAAKRACVIRYGALGDMVLLTPLIRQLAEDGYEVTMNITPYAAPLLDNNPYVSNIVFQERDAIPNIDLGEYWDEWRGDYDKYINLSESIEGALLKVEGRKDFFTTQAWRHESSNKNYQDWTMRLAGYPGATGRRGELYFTPAERKEAQRFRKEHEGKFIVLWAINGSSHHKLYPLMMPVASEWLNKHPDAIVVTLGDANAKKYEFEHPQVIPRAGVWSIRQTLAVIAYATDCVIGPESMAVNVASCYDVPKITFLSHSTHENLCKYWANDFCLEPNIAISPCYPCHQLHYNADSCPTGELRDSSTHEILSRGPMCAMGAISGDRVIARLDEVHALSAKPELSVVQ